MESNEPEYHIIEPQLQADGKQAWLDTNRIPLHDSEGNVIGLLGTYEDITDRINADIALKRSEQSYKDAYNRANFLRDLFSHDMNNILQGVQSGTELINLYLKSQNTVAIRKIMKIIYNEIKRGVRLTKNINTFSQIDTETKECYNIKVKEVLNSAKKFLFESYPNKDIKMQIEAKEKEFIVNANEFLLDVFHNLLINAVVFNDHHEIEIMIKISDEIQNSKSYVKIQVIDNGIGVEEDRKKIIFQRTENMDKQITGLGLGLSLAKKIIEYFDGIIWVEDRVKNNYKEGSNFIILIPAFEN